MDPQLRLLFGRTAARVSLAEQLPVGARLHIELESLSSEQMDAETAIRVHALWVRLESRIAARKMVAINDALNGMRDRLMQPPTHDEAEMLAAHELACATHIAYATARCQLGLVQQVGHCMPASWEALDRGDISLAHLKAIDRATRCCTAKITEAVDAHVVPLAVERGWTPSETGRAASKLVLGLDPEGAAERADAAKKDSDVRFFPQPDEVADLNTHGEAALLRQAYDALNATAEEMGRAGDERPVGLRRVHALVNAVLGAPDGEVKRPQGEVLAMGRITTLLGEDNQPGELVGYGPICADTLRRLAADHRLRRLLTDPLTGAVLDLGRRSYAPSARLRKAIQATNPTCTAPGCCLPSVHCEIDHRKEFHRSQDPGRTDQCNLKPMCKMHHDLKTKKYWKVDQHPDGSETWTSYLGFTYIKRTSDFPLPDPPPIEDEAPSEVADRLPGAFDSDPPYPDEPLPEPPPITDEEYVAMDRAIEGLNIFGDTFRAWCERHYDEARANGLVA